MVAEQGPLHLETDVCQQATWMSHFIVPLAKARGFNVGPTRRRPAGACLPIWTRCFRLKVADDVVRGLDDVFQQIVGKPIL